MRAPIIAILLLIMIFPFSSCFGKPRIFTTFAKAKQVGNVGEMVFDGRYYWFEGLLNSSSCYDTVKKEFKVFDAAKIPKLGPILTMEVVNGQAWFGLNTKGIAIFDQNLDNFKIINDKDGLPYYFSSNEKITKVSALKYDPYRKRVWAGVIRSGLAYYDLELMKWLIVNDSIINDLNINITDLDITSLDVKNDIIVASSYDGVYIFSYKNNNWQKCYKLQQEEIKSDHILIHNNIVIFCIRRNDDTGIIAEYDLVSKEVVDILKWDTIISDLKKYENYLIFSSNKGVTFYNIDNKKQKTFTKSYGLISNWVNSVYFEGENMWVLTQDGISKAKIKDVLKELEDIK